MEPTTFQGATHNIAKDQEDYLTLPAHINPVDGVVTSCWKLTFRERVKVFLTGRFWFQVWTFGSPLQPQRPDVDRPIP